MLLSLVFSLFTVPLFAAEGYDYFAEQPSPSDAPVKAPTQKLADALDDCSDEGRNWIPYAGVEATFFSPQLSGGGDTITLTNALAGTVTVFNANDANLGYLGLAPRFWVGMSNCNGVGIRARYWQLNQAATAHDPLNPVGIPGDVTGFTALNNLRMYAADVELTKDLCWGNWDLLGSVGVRNARLQRGSSLSATGLVDLGGGAFDVLSATTNSGATFDGTGLTFGIQGLRNIRCCECGTFDLFASGRASILWGQSSSYAGTSAVAFGPGIFAASIDSADVNGLDDDMFITEFQVGVQWSRDLICCNARAFARLTFEYQNWDINNGGLTASLSSANRPGIDDITARASGRSLQSLDLVGVGIATGFYW